MPRINYKYRIREKLATLNSDDQKIANNFLPGFLKISTPTYIKYKNLRLDEGGDIPAETLMKLSLFFECNPAELCAYSLDYSKMVKDFNELRNQSYPDYVFSKKFT